jgi:hypothetical protein
MDLIKSNNKEQHIPFLILSFLGHITISFLLAQSQESTQPLIQDLVEDSVKVDNITPEKLQEIKNLAGIKTLGVKDGKEDFQVKVGDTKNPEASPQGSVKGPTEKEVSLENLAPTKAPQSLKKIEKVASSTPVPFKAIHAQTTTTNKRKTIQLRPSKSTRTRLIRDFAPKGKYGEILSNSSLNFEFARPKGVPANELNSFEKIFYGFQVRTYKKYLNAFLSAYNHEISAHPHLKEGLLRNRHFLKGRVTFDINGDIMAIKIMQDSNNDYLLRIFERTLQKMDPLANPPKNLFIEEDQFSVYFQLSVSP